ncbi:Flagellar biosynthetic protein fliR [uncultured Desulfatiglans sp.]|uniref:Flagellar biosynthetic protein FliR n=1 Tax=Uncultured Desulfatiglans sp. TaxID=1748965 RepID=A0A653A3H6_UNCDX|nr:Flagellar biosynthetic protein fliR [uncultured Desulfatiglans sp.]
MQNIIVNVLDVQNFFLIFVRVTSMLFFLPIFDSRVIPVIFKAGLSLAMSLLLFHYLSPTIHLADPLGPVPLVLGVAGEVFMGAGIALSVKLILAGVQLAGQLAGFQMGLAIANVVDPLTSEQSSETAMVLNLFAMLVFLAVDAHHWFLRALAASFEQVGPLSLHLSPSFVESLLTLSGAMFVIAIKVAAPIIAALLLTSAALGLVARTVPQMNIFIVAFPLKIMVGFLLMALSLPYISSYLSELFHTFGRELVLMFSGL